jgi:hypothetical protein
LNCLEFRTFIFSVSPVFFLGGSFCRKFVGMFLSIMEFTLGRGRRTWYANTRKEAGDMLKEIGYKWQRDEMKAPS